MPQERRCNDGAALTFFVVGRLCRNDGAALTFFVVGRLRCAWPMVFAPGGISGSFSTGSSRDGRAGVGAEADRLTRCGGTDPCVAFIPQDEALVCTDPPVDSRVPSTKGASAITRKLRPFRNILIERSRRRPFGLGERGKKRARHSRHDRHSHAIFGLAEPVAAHTDPKAGDVPALPMRLARRSPANGNGYHRAAGTPGSWLGPS